MTYNYLFGITQFVILFLDVLHLIYANVTVANNYLTRYNPYITNALNPFAMAVISPFEDMQEVLLRSGKYGFDSRALANFHFSNQLRSKAFPTLSIMSVIEGFYMRSSESPKESLLKLMYGYEEEEENINKQLALSKPLVTEIMEFFNLKEK